MAELSVLILPLGQYILISWDSFKKKGVTVRQNLILGKPLSKNWLNSNMEVVAKFTYRRVLGNKSCFTKLGQIGPFLPINNVY